MVKNTGIISTGISGTPELMGGGVDPMALLMSLLYPQGSQQVHPLIAQMLGTNGDNRVRQINEAVSGAGGAPFSSGVNAITESVPVAPQRSTQELLKAIDRMAVKPSEKKPKVRVEVVPVTVKTKDGEELMYRDKNGKLYPNDPNE
jgi:hypothetical protein